MYARWVPVVQPQQDLRDGHTPTTTREQHAAWLTTAEVAARLETSVWTVFRLLKRGELTAYRYAPRGPYRFPRASVERLLNDVVGDDAGTA